ncbi:hypothetical protein [Streptomyces sp. NPDC127098]|uniref:hypothetical protein n=1 Tax=Streptomyces sp. NPDC127098 TaxID=3347137 RepID=UPI00364E50BA
MSSDAIAGLHEVHNLLVSFGDAPDIRRAPVLEGAAEKVAASATELVDVTEPEDLQMRLLWAVRSLEAARKAGRAHRRNPLTRPLSHARFALRIGAAQGSLHVVLAALDPENTPPVPVHEEK